MTEQLCPACGCTVTGGGYEKGGQTYCCEPCATEGASACECGCCAPAGEGREDGRRQGQQGSQRAA